MISLVNKNSTNKKLQNILEAGLLCKAVGILLLIIFSGLLGNYVAMITTRQIDNSLTKFIIGIVIGFWIGICVGTAGQHVLDIVLRLRLMTLPQANEGSNNK